MKTLKKNQVIKAAIKIAKEANKSLEKILKDSDMFFEPYDSWKDGAIDHSKDINDNWENVSIRNVRNANNLFFELCDDIKDKDIILSAFKYKEVKNRKTTVFRYISNLDIKNSNIKIIVSMERKRWKIEKECFYTQ